MRSFTKKDSRLLRREIALKSNLKKRRKFKEKKQKKSYDRSF
tara:strand:- start:296 stop:421 length:126 start_codon:yes stop_codon:yes gene_type:complete